MAEDQLFYVGQKAFIENEKGQLLVLNDPQLGLDFPGGKIQIGELDSAQALKREVKEETGLDIEVGKPFYSWFYQFGQDHRNAGKLIYVIGFHCTYLGGEVILSDEHDRFEWVSKRDYHRFNGEPSYEEALKKYIELDD